MCDVYVDLLDKEIKKNVVDFDAAEELANSLHAQMYNLQKKKDEPLTRKELAERKILINFVLISKMGTEGSPFLEEFKRFLKDRVGVTPRQLEEDKVLPDIEGAEGQTPGRVEVLHGVDEPDGSSAHQLVELGIHTASTDQLTGHMVYEAQVFAHQLIAQHGVLALLEDLPLRSCFDHLSFLTAAVPLAIP